MVKYKGYESEFFKKGKGTSISEHLAEETQKMLDDTGSNIKLNLKKIKENGEGEGKDNEAIEEEQEGFLI